MEIVDTAEVIAVHDTVWTIPVLHLFGDLDLSNAASLERELLTLASAPRAVIDLSDCNYVDGTAIRTLLGALQSRGDALRVIAPDGSAAARALQIAQVGTGPAVFTSLASAVQW